VPKLAPKVALSQLQLGTSLGVPSPELIDADYLARGRLGGSLTNWQAAVSLNKDLRSFEEQFKEGDWPQGLADHLKTSKVLASSLFTDFKVRVEDFFKTR